MPNAFPRPLFSLVRGLGLATRRDNHGVIRRDPGGVLLRTLNTRSCVPGWKIMHSHNESIAVPGG